MPEAKKCKVGFPCGKSCISRLRKCWNNLPIDGESKQFETFSQFVNRIVGTGNDKESAIKNDIKLPEFDINVKLDSKKVIGQGAFGKVYDYGDVVVKEGEVTDNEKYILQFLNEKEFPNSPILVGQSKTRLAMKKAPGDTLWGLSYKGENPNTEDNQNILNAVKELHNLGVAHGDIHGGNVMYDMKTKKVTLIDFGFAETADLSAHDDVQTPKEFGYTKLRDAFYAQQLYGNPKKHKKLIEKISWTFIGRTPRDINEAFYEIDLGNPKVVAMLEDEKALDDFLDEFYQV